MVQHVGATFCISHNCEINQFSSLSFEIYIDMCTCKYMLLTLTLSLKVSRLRHVTMVTKTLITMETMLLCDVMWISPFSPCFVVLVCIQKERLCQCSFLWFMSCIHQETTRLLVPKILHFHSHLKDKCFLFLYFDQTHFLLI